MSFDEPRGFDVGILELKNNIINDLQIQLNKLRVGNEHYEVELGNYKKKVRFLEEQIAKYKKDVDTLTKLNIELRDNLVENVKDIKQAKNDVNLIRDKANKCKEATSVVLAKFNNKLILLNQKLSQCIKKDDDKYTIDDLECKIDTFISMYNSKVKEYSEVITEINVVIRNNRDLQSYIDVLESKISQLESNTNLNDFIIIDSCKIDNIKIYKIGDENIIADTKYNTDIESNDIILNKPYVIENNELKEYRFTSCSLVYDGKPNKPSMDLLYKYIKLTKLV